MASWSTYDPEAPNQLISYDDISADASYWQDMAPTAGPAVLLGRATRHLNRTSSMMRKLSEKLEQDKMLLAYQADQLADHKHLLQNHSKMLLAYSAGGIVMKWRARVLAHIDAQIEAVRNLEAALITMRSVITCFSSQIMGPFPSDMLSLSYGEYAPAEPDE